jgi:hypothetical protein
VLILAVKDMADDEMREVGRPLLTRCARPSVGARPWSTYTLFGFGGYAAASLFASALAITWELSLGERLVALVAPPMAFIAVVTAATAIAGREHIVLYQAALGAAAAVALGGLAVGGRMSRLFDVALLGIAAFLVFGRLGCFHVACCHGRPSRRGVAYGPAHVAAGFWARWAGRPLFPVQLVESAGCAVLVAAGLAASGSPGAAAAIVASGYALLRFSLELLRGDDGRPHWLGLSEAQWFSLAAAALVAALRPSAPALIALAAIAIAAASLVIRRRRRELFLAPHIHELDRLCAEVLADPARARRDSRTGVGLSCHPLADGRQDWVLSSAHPAWSPRAARRIAGDLWPGAEVIEGRTPGVIHVIAPARSIDAA